MKPAPAAFRLFGLVVALALSPGFGQGEAPPPREGLRISRYAPPTIPHDLDDPACLECHGHAEAGAPEVPHPAFANCLQCHVPQTGTALFRGNGFLGVPEPARLSRAYVGAPPVAPHRYFMRQNCLACHGKDAPQGIVSTPHPERSHCRQCHLEQDGVVGLFKGNARFPDVAVSGRK